MSPTQTVCPKGDSLFHSDKQDGSSSHFVLDVVQVCCWQYSESNAQTVCLDLDKIYNLIDNVKARLPVSKLDSLQRICSQRRSVGCKVNKPLPSCRKLRNGPITRSYPKPSAWTLNCKQLRDLSTRSHIRLFKATYMYERYVREPKSITSRLRAAHISDPG